MADGTVMKKINSPRQFVSQ